LPEPGHFLADSALALAGDHGTDDRLRPPRGL